MDPINTHEKWHESTNNSFNKQKLRISIRCLLHLQFYSTFQYFNCLFNNSLNISVFAILYFTYIIYETISSFLRNHLNESTFDEFSLEFSGHNDRLSIISVHSFPISLLPFSVNFFVCFDLSSVIGWLITCLPPR